MIMSLVVIFGTAGASDQNQINIGQAILQCGIAMAAGLVSWFLFIRNERKQK